MKCIRNRILVPVIIIFFLIIIFVFILIGNRYFFNFNGMNWTVWNTKNQLYLIPEKYFGFKLPDSDYIRIKNNSDLIVFVDEENVFHIFSDNCIAPYKPDVILKNNQYVVYPYEEAGKNYEKMNVFENRDDIAEFEYEALDNWGFVKEKYSIKKEVLKSDTKWVLQRFLLAIFYYRKWKMNVDFKVDIMYTIDRSNR